MNYRFCFRCGHSLEKKKEFLLCEGCGYHHYQNPTPCNGVIIENKDGDVLLVKRAFEPKKGYWDVAGGFTKIGETMEESAKRELMEELHVDITDLNYLGSFIDTYKFMDEVSNTLCFMYVAKVTDEKIKVDADVSGYKFFKKTEIPFDKIAFSGVVKALKIWIKNSPK